MNREEAISNGLTDSIGFFVFLQIIGFNRQEKEEIDARTKRVSMKKKKKKENDGFVFFDILNVRISSKAFPIPFDRVF